MGAYLYSVAITILVLGITKSGDCLRCWQCSSSGNQDCDDHFNTTQIMNRNLYSAYNSPPIPYQGIGQNIGQGIGQGIGNMPLLSDCRSNYQFGGKTVCKKKKQTSYGRTIITRECHDLAPHEYVGSCPTERTSSQISVDFCEYCDYDGCNGATGLKTNVFLASLGSIAVMLFLRK